MDKNTASEPNRHRASKVIIGILALFVAILLVTIPTLDKNKDLKKPNIVAVSITKSGFEPATISVKQGTRIIWTNKDDQLHKIASNPYPTGTDLPNLKSEILNNQQSFEYVATKTGKFGYHDDQKPTINGTLVVEEQ